jgi:hypothetical protein
MYKITLKSLRCVKQNDLFGADECRLEFTLDGSFQAPIRQNLKKGQEWDLNGTYTFGSTVLMKLWEEDPLRISSLIGKTEVGTGLCENTLVSFNTGASYVLCYSVSEIEAHGVPIDPVQEAILRFENSTQAGVWTNIPKAELIADIRARVANPFRINQVSTPLCGPASIVFDLVSHDPRRYVEICQSLYEDGQFPSRTHTIQPSDTLIHSRVRKEMSVADWMLMTTLRDTENVIFPVEDASSVFVMGFTKPWEMRGWTYELLNYDHAEFDSLIFYGEFEAMRKAQDVVDHGGVAFMMIQSALLGNPKPFMSYPDHWITFLGDVHIDEGVWNRKGGHIHFDCYTWGERKHIDIDEKPFEDFTWGIVYGLP